MDGRVVLITGGNSGIGEATAVGLAKLGADVAIVSRSFERGEAAIARIKAASGRSVRMVAGDLSAIASVDALADTVLDRFPKLHVLINNAGLAVTERTVTKDGYETTFAVNHLGPFALTRRLLDRLRESGTARVVNVASTLYKRGALDFDDLMSERGFNGMRAYARSKMCNVLFTRELARRVQGTGITTNCLHPGVIHTNLGHDASGLIGLAFKLSKPFLATPEKGARTSIYLAASPDVASVSGEYFEQCKRHKLIRAARDDAAAARLWEISDALVEQARAGRQA